MLQRDAMVVLIVDTLERIQRHVRTQRGCLIGKYATQPMIDRSLDQLRYEKAIEDSLIIYGQAYVL